MELNNYWKGIQEGDEKSLEELFRKVNSLLCCYAAFIVEDDSVAQEIVQDVFIKIWQDRNRIIVRDSLKSYLYKSVKNKAINVLASNKTKKATVNKLLSGESWEIIQENFEFDDFIIEKIEAGEIYEKIMALVNDLPEQCRKIFLLSRVENLSNKEIAIQLKISEHTVKAHLYKALESLKKIFD